MTFRQIMVCLIVGPMCAILLAGAICISPLFLAIGLLLGADDPVRSTWEIVTEPPIGMFKECYSGIADSSQ
jgi:hypothetical protein